MSPDVCCFWYPPHFKRLTIFINLYNQETSFHWKHWWEVGRLFPWKFSTTVIAYWVHTLSGTLTLMPLWQPCEWKDLHPQDIKWKCYLVNRVYLQPHGLCSPPGSSVHEILQARTLKWVAIPFSRKWGAWAQKSFFVPWVPKDRFKHLLIRNGRGCRKKGRTVKKQ